MDRRNVQRGGAAVAFVVALTLVGAQPAAAAQSPGFLNRLVSAWSAVSGTGNSLVNLWDGLSGRKRFAANRVQEKKGQGIDPNGLVVAIEEDGEKPGPVSIPGGQ